MKRKIGIVQAIWRYPVKSLRGEMITEAQLTENGIVGDRMWALRELSRGGIMSARIWPSMLELSASYIERSDAVGPLVQINLPDGGAIEPQDPRAAEVLSNFLGRELRLERVQRERLSEDEIEAIVSGNAFPPSRDFYDEDVMHLIATGTLEHLRQLRPDADFDPRRFRANIYVDTGGESGDFIEDRWLEGELLIAEARIAGLRPAIRCVMTTHPQSGLPQDPSILRTAAQHHGAYVGVFAAIGTPGKIRVGDEVILSSQAR